MRPIIEPTAQADLLAIWRHLAEESVAAADRWLEATESAIATLGEHPALGHCREDFERPGLRFYTARQRPAATIIYRSDTTPIRVLRVAGRGRDLGALLEDGES